MSTEERMTTKQEVVEKIAICLCGDSHNPKEHEALADVIFELVMQSEVKLWQDVAKELCKYNGMEPDGALTLADPKPVGLRPLPNFLVFSDAARDAINLIRSGKC
jgi:hypothetical protein